MSAVRTTVRNPPTVVPPLENGDHLTRDEFERRYEAMPHVKKAELIEGVVYMPSAVRLTLHGSPHADLITWLGVYRAGTPGVRVGDNTSVRLDLDNEPQPEALMIVEPGYGGRVKISDDDYVEGAPDLAAEVAASSASIDLNLKFRVYRRKACRNTSSGACPTRPSIGSSSGAVSTSGWRSLPQDAIKARSSPDCGSTRRPWYGSTSPGCSRSCSRGSPAPSTRPSSRGCTKRLPAAGEPGVMKTQEGTMKRHKFPAGWDEKRVREVIAHYASVYS
jgi:hypothetical protein